MRAFVLGCAAWIWICAGTARAQEPGDALFVTGQLDLAQAAGGGTGGVEWLRTSQRGGAHVGVLSGSRGDAWWTYGRAGGFVRRQRVTVSGTLDAGGGSQGGAPFNLQKFSGEAIVPVAPGRVFLETEGQLARLAGDVRRILRLGVKSHVSTGVMVGASYYLISHGGTLAPAMSGRIDVERGRISVLGGAVLARQDGSTMLLSRVDTLLTGVEVFVGGGFDAGSYRVQVVGNHAGQPAANRLLVNIRIPLGSNEQGER